MRPVLAAQSKTPSSREELFAVFAQHGMDLKRVQAALEEAEEHDDFEKEMLSESSTCYQRMCSSCKRPMQVTAQTQSLIGEESGLNICEHCEARFVEDYERGDISAVVRHFAQHGV